MGGVRVCRFQTSAGYLRFDLQGSSFQNAWTSFVTVWENWGLMGLYRGILPGLLCNFTHAGAVTLTYSAMKHWLLTAQARTEHSAQRSEQQAKKIKKRVRMINVARSLLTLSPAGLKIQRSRRVTQLLISIIASSVVGTVVSMPFDVVRTQMQINMLSGSSDSSTSSVISSIYSQFGCESLHCQLVPRFISYFHRNSLRGFFDGIVSRCIRSSLHGTVSYLVVLGLGSINSSN
jgi:hypothetical protein